MESATYGIKVTDLSVDYGEVSALKDVSFTLRPGTVTGLIGPNGCGKSTLFKSVIGTIKPTSGTIEFGAGTLDEVRKRRLIGYVPQHEDIDATFPITVHSVVATGRGVGRPTPRDRELIEAAMRHTGVWDLRNRRIGALSGGQRKRVFIARSLAQDARILLLDEPFAGVDIPNEKAIAELLQELCVNRTVLVSTHHLGTLGDLCQQTVLLNKTVIATGSVDEVLTPANLARTFGMEA